MISNAFSIALSLITLFCGIALTYLAFGDQDVFWMVFGQALVVWGSIDVGIILRDGVGR